MTVNPFYLVIFSPSANIYTARQINLPCSITSCAQPHKEIFAAVAGAILTADFIGREYNSRNCSVPSQQLSVFSTAK